MDHSEVKHFPKVDHTPAELDETSRVLLAAAALMDKASHHCTNGKMRDGMGGFCIWGAIEAVTDSYQAPMKRMTIALGGDPTDEWMSFMPTCNWNNTHTKDEVVAKLRAVALGLA